MSGLEEEARQRETLHAGQTSRRPLSEGYDLVGLAGEQAFWELTGLPRDDTEHPGGDRGVDFLCPFTIDVKTARKPTFLLVEQGKIRASVYVLARYVEDQPAEMLGWAFGREVTWWPTKDFGHGVHSHYRPAQELREIRSLFGLIHKLNFPLPNGN